MEDISYPSRVILADLIRATDALDTAAAIAGEHFDDDAIFATITAAITCAGALAFSALSALRTQSPARLSRTVELKTVRCDPTKRG